MITIGPASYFSTANRYADASRSRAANSSSDVAEQQATDSKATSGEPAGADPRSSATTFNVMGQQYKLIPLDASKMKPLDISTLPEDQYREFMEGEKSRIEANEWYLKLQHTTRETPDLSNYPGNKPYATVTIGGQEVAKIFNDGSVQTDSDGITDRIRGILESTANEGGPEGAQARAEQIAQKLGGRVAKAPTALTQAQYNALPHYVQPEPVVDYEGMKNDLLYAQVQQWKQHYSQIEQNRAAYLASQQSGVDISA